MYREAQALGKELERIGEETLGAVTEAEVAVYFDWDNWWAIECSAGPSCELKYKDEVYLYYEALHSLNIPADIVGEEDDLERYKVLIAPILYMTKPGYDEKIRRFVEKGGVFVTTFFSGIVDEHDLVITGGYPGRLRDILGIWVEESDALPHGVQNEFSYQGIVYPAKLLCDLSHPEGAEVLSTYEKDFYQGMPAITKNSFGKGEAYYVATRSDRAFYEKFIGTLCKEAGIRPVAEPQKKLEATIRSNENGRYLFLLNHGEEMLSVILEYSGKELLSGNTYQAGEKVKLPAKGVFILRLQE